MLLMRGRLLAISGHVLAIILGTYGLVGGYLRDYADSCTVGVSGGSSAAVEAFDDFCGSGPKIPPIPPYGPWGWIGAIGVILGLLGLAVALFRPVAKTVGNPNISVLRGFDPQPDPPAGTRSVTGTQGG
jgi:hypothetical protein